MVLNPATPVESIQHSTAARRVTVMTVDPGYAGQPFIPEMPPKLRSFIIKETGSLRFLLEVDGPVTATPTARCWAPAHRY